MQRVPVNEHLWERVAAAAVARCYELARTGVMQLPITCTISQVDDDGPVLFQFVLPDLEGGAHMGDLCPIRVDRVTYLPLRFVIEDGVVIHSCLFEVPAGVMQ